MKKILTFVVVLCIGTGCTETVVSPTIKVSVINDRSPNSDETKVVLTLTNASHSNIYLTHSENLVGFWRIQRRIDNSWVEADRGTINHRSVYPNDRKMLTPGDMLRDSLTMTQAGEYRIALPFALDENETYVDSLPADEFIVQ